jgi:O-antigen/teichoic acid export membrane protein
MFLLFIGKFFSLSQLGFYTRADQFRSIPSENLNNMISRVSYPILSEIQDDKVLLKKAYIKLIRNTMFLSFNLMIILAAIADPLIKVLLGIKWQSTSNYLELLCFVGMLYPLHSLNLNMLQVQGKGGLFLKLELIKKLFTIPIIITAYYFGISAMIIAMFIHSSLSYLLNSYWSGNHIEYSAKSQIKDIIPSFLFAIIIGLPIYLIGQYPVFSSFYTLSLQLIIAIILFFSMGELTSNNEYLYIKTTLLSKFLDK